MTTPTLPDLPEPHGAIVGYTGSADLTAEVRTKTRDAYGAPLYTADQMRAYARAALSAAPAAPFNVEAMLTACVPGGASCDPQHVADAIRAYCAAPAAPVGDVQPVAWLCKLMQEDGSTREQIVTENPDGLRWNDAGEPSPYNVTPLYAVPVAQQASEPADPMDWPLPCDVKVGHGTMRKGVALRTLVARMKVLYEMATGENADRVANRTPEQRAELAAEFQRTLAAAHTQQQAAEPTLWQLMAAAKALHRTEQDNRDWAELRQHEIDALRVRATAVLRAAHAQQQAATVQPLQSLIVTRVEPGFRWNGERQHHVPNLLIEFEPVPANGPCDAKGWRDRDSLADTLSGIAATQQAPTTGEG